MKKLKLLYLNLKAAIRATRSARSVCVMYDDPDPEEELSAAYAVLRSLLRSNGRIVITPVDLHEAFYGDMRIRHDLSGQLILEMPDPSDEDTDPDSNEPA